MKLAIAITLALVPGLLNWIWGRGLLQRAEAADLPERLWRHRKRVTMAIIWVLIASALLGGLWMVPLVIVGALVGGFPARRKLLKETWGLAAYVLFQVRLYLGFAGFWILLASTPVAMVHIPAAWQWPAAGLFAFVLFLTSWYFSRLFPWIWGARRLEGEAREPFEPYLAPVLQRTTAADPVLWQVPMGGGRFANAVALPSRRRPGVLFWETLLKLFEPREVGAVFAHEVAHLEQFNPRVLRRMATLEWFLIAAAVSCAPLTLPAFGTTATLWLPLIWLAVVLVGLVARTNLMRGYETGADLRALELCGDPQALVSALEKLHTVSRLPRRLGNREEGRISHPTLARRIAAIRQVAGTDSEDGGEPGEEDSSLLLTVLDSGDGRRVLFEERQVSWLEGVPEEVEATPEALMATASRITTLAYPELTELRLQPNRGGSMLRATDTAGRSWEIPVPQEGVTPVQAALDRVDPLLTTPSRPQGGALDALFRGLSQLAAFLGGLLALFPALLFSLFSIGVLASLWPRAAMLAGFAAAAVGGIFFLAGDDSNVDGAALPTMIGLSLAAAAAAFGAWYRRRSMTVQDGAESEPSPGARGQREGTGAVKAGIVFGGSTLLAVFGCGAWLALAGTLNTFELHQLAAGFPGLGLLALAAAASWSLARGPRRRLRWLRVPFLAMGLAWLAVAGPLFERVAVRDSLLVPRELPTPASIPWHEVAAVELGSRPPAMVRTSPSGRRFALLVPTDEEPESERRRWVLGGFEDGVDLEGPHLEAEEVRFVDEDTLLVLQFEAVEPFQPGTVHVRQVAVAELETPLWQIELPGLAYPGLGVGNGTWWVAGPPGFQRQEGGFFHYQGVMGEGSGSGNGVEARQWSPPPQDTFLDLGYWTAGGNDEALAWTMIHNNTAAPWGWWSALLRRPQWELWSVPSGPADEGAAVRRLKTRLEIDCTADSNGVAALCLASAGETGHLWRVPLSPDGAPTPLARLPGTGYAEMEWDSWGGRGALIEGYGGRLWRLSERGILTEIYLPQDGRLLDATLTAEEELAAVVRAGSTYRLVRLARRAH